MTSRSVERTAAGARRGVTRAVILTAAAALLVTVAGLALLANIFERRQEARHPFHRVVELTDTTVNPEVWGQNFPLQYDQYLRTTDQVRTRHGGSEAIPRTPDQVDPRAVVARSRLEEDPRLITMWAGYPFATDTREARGHAYMLEDQLYTERQLVVRQPGACVQCHASVYVAYRRLGDGDLVAGFRRMNAMDFAEAREHVTHPITCIDCHEPSTMRLRVTRPAFMIGMRDYMATRGVSNYDVNTMATRQEMRTFVCGQCHVEYYFTRGERQLVYPWAKGLLADSILAYFDSTGHYDWVHGETGAAVLKAQHPEFEMFQQGTHARAGVACADCHMPYMRVGAMKISDHHVRSPLLNINRACQPCHSVAEAELLARAEGIQDRHFELRHRAMNALVELIADLRNAIQADSTQPGISEARRYQRQAQFLLDFVEAENSMGFHAAQESARVLAKSTDLARQGQIVLHGGRVIPEGAVGAPHGSPGSR